jgi:hypothetical protein
MGLVRRRAGGVPLRVRAVRRVPVGYQGREGGCDPWAAPLPARWRAAGGRVQTPLTSACEWSMLGASYVCAGRTPCSTSPPVTRTRCGCARDAALRPCAQEVCELGTCVPDRMRTLGLHAAVRLGWTALFTSAGAPPPPSLLWLVQHDWIGLHTLDAQKKVDLLSFVGGHIQFTQEFWDSECPVVHSRPHTCRQGGFGAALPARLFDRPASCSLYPVSSAH